MTGGKIGGGVCVGWELTARRGALSAGVGEGGLRDRDGDGGLARGLRNLRYMAMNPFGHPGGLVCSGAGKRGGAGEPKSARMTSASAAMSCG